MDTRQYRMVLIQKYIVIEGERKERTDATESEGATELTGRHSTVQSKSRCRKGEEECYVVQRYTEGKRNTERHMRQYKEKEG